MKVLVLLSTIGMTTIVVLLSIMMVDKNQKTAFALEQCRIQSVVQKEEIGKLKAEREFVKKEIGVFYPKFEWKEKK